MTIQYLSKITFFKLRMKSLHMKNWSLNFPSFFSLIIAIKQTRDATTELKTIFQALAVYSQPTDVSQLLGVGK